MSQDEYRALKVKESTLGFLDNMGKIKCLPWRNVYDKSYLPFSARKFCENLTRLQKEGVPDEKAYPIARKTAQYARANSIMLWTAASAREYQFSATGTQHFFNKILPEKYPQFLEPNAKYSGVKKGETLQKLVSFYPLPTKNDETNRPDPSQKTSGLEQQKRRMGMSTHPEMFLEQTVGIDVRKFISASPPVVTQSFEKGLSLCADFAAHLNIEIRPGLASDNAAFRYALDADGEFVERYAQIPPVEGFTSPAECLSATFHELAHAAHSFIEPEVFTSRIKEGSKFHDMSDDNLSAYKEVVAEFTAALVVMNTDIVLTSELRNSAAYVNAFMTSIDDLSEIDRLDLIRSGITVAGKIADSMLAHDPEFGLDIDDYIEQSKEDKQRAIEDHNQLVAKHHGKPANLVTNQDRIDYLKASVSLDDIPAPSAEKPEPPLQGQYRDSGPSR